MARVQHNRVRVLFMLKYFSVARHLGASHQRTGSLSACCSVITNRAFQGSGALCCSWPVKKIVVVCGLYSNVVLLGPLITS